MGQGTDHAKPERVLVPYLQNSVIRQLVLAVRLQISLSV